MTRRDDAPALADFLAVLAGPAEPGELAGEQAARAAFAEYHRTLAEEPATGGRWRTRTAARTAAGRAPPRGVPRRVDAGRAVPRVAGETAQPAAGALTAAQLAAIRAAAGPSQSVAEFCATVLSGEPAGPRATPSNPGHGDENPGRGRTGPPTR